MSDDLVEIAGRVQRLERDNRRLKLAGGAMAAVLVAVPLVGAALPAQVPEVIEAGLFRVLDEQGTPRAALGAAGLGFSDEQGRGRVGLGAAGLGFYDEQGTLRVTLRADGLLSVIDEQGTPRAVFDAGSLFFNDEQGTTRLQLGRVTVVNPSTTAETTYPAALVLFDEAGAVIERLPR